MAQPGRATDAITEYVDVYPTLADLAGLPAPAGLSGRSLRPVLEDPMARGREFALSQFSRPFNAVPESMGYSLRTETLRYTRWVRWPSRETFAEELYDYSAPVSAVPRWTAFVERANLIDDPAYRAERARLSAAMDDVLANRSVVAAERAGNEGEKAGAKRKKRKQGE